MSPIIIPIIIIAACAFSYAAGYLTAYLNGKPDSEEPHTASLGELPPPDEPSPYCIVEFNDGTKKTYPQKGYPAQH